MIQPLARIDLDQEYPDGTDTRSVLASISSVCTEPYSDYGGQWR
jgi:hypothetical protein